MTNQSYSHEAVAWAKHRLDDLDAIIAAVESSAEELRSSAETELSAISDRLNASRSKIQKQYEDLKAEADGAKRSATEIQEALEAEWVEVELAFRSLLSVAGERAETVKGIVVARSQAQRNSWEATLKDIQDKAADAVDKVGDDFDALIKRIAEEAEKIQTRIGDAKDAGEGSWEAIKTGLADAKVIHDRTILKIKSSLSRLV